jgi:hypothetical protein
MANAGKSRPTNCPSYLDAAPIFLWIKDVQSPDLPFLGQETKLNVLPWSSNKSPHGTERKKLPGAILWIS